MITIEEILSGAQEHAVAFENRGLAVLEVRGKDGLDLLHRLSTNDLLSGPTPRARRSILTTEKGRIVDLVHLLVTDSGIRMLVSANGRQKVTDWVEKFTITEDIILVDLSADFVAVYVLGHNASDVTNKVLGVEIAHPCVEVFHSDFGSVSFWREDYGTGSAGVFLLRRTHADGFLTSVELAGATRLDGIDEIETLRILAGEPAYGQELAEPFNPLELGLRNAVSFTKGCYVGQEVIARLDSYMKVQRELVAIDLREPLSATGVGDDVVSAGESVGILTSITGLAFADGRRRGLAVVRRSTEPRSTTVAVRSQDGSANGDIVPMLSLGRIGEGKG
jgi:tRNA-modifying protein YgfZ